MTLAPPSLPYDAALGGRLKDFIRYAEVRQLVHKIIDLQRSPRTGFSSLAVLSVLPREGKTLLCALLAAGYADTARSRVLLVDTATFHHPKSLSLAQCVDPAHPMIEHLSLADHRYGAEAPRNGAAPNGNGAANGSLQAEIMDEVSMTAAGSALSDHYLVTKVTKGGSKQYGLVLLDTAPLSARNKNNLDPTLVARLSDASVLVAGTRTLNSPELPRHMATLEDPSLHLIGVVSNEEFSR